MSRPAAVREIKDTVIDDTAPASASEDGGIVETEIDVVYWEFEMTRDGIVNPYWMVTLKLEDGQLWAGFTNVQDDARDALGEYTLNYTSLSMPWTFFRRAARRALNARPNPRGEIALPEGYLTKLTDTEIVYTTACGIEYHLTAATLEGLLR